MVIERTRELSASETLQNFEKIQRFVYLGSLLEANGGTRTKLDGESHSVKLQ